MDKVALRQVTVPGHKFSPRRYHSPNTPLAFLTPTLDSPNEPTAPDTTQQISRRFVAPLIRVTGRGSEKRAEINRLTPNDHYRGGTAPLTSKVAFYIFIQEIWVLNILNTVYTLRLFSSSKCSLFHNSNIFGSCIPILYIYSTNIGTEYFKHGTYSPFIFLFKMQFVS